MIKYILICLLLAVMLLNTFWRKHGNLTKSLLMPLLLACYLVSADKISVIVIIAIIGSFLGDVLLIKWGTAWFISGGIGFIVSHIFYSLAYTMRTDFTKVNYIIIAAAVIIYFTLSVITIKNVRGEVDKRFKIPLLIYLMVNSVMNVFALMLLLSQRNIESAVIYAGAVLFFISDVILFIECFDEKKTNLFYLVMPTYVIGELFIVMGLAQPMIK